jgi:hypothetical protein
MRISGLDWGRIELEDGSVYKDVKLFPGCARTWDWRETGTSHGNGVQPGDVEELLQHGATVIVIGTGVYEALRIHPDTLKLLKDRTIPVHILQTEKAVEKYNELCADTAVGGLFHSTC